MRRHLLLPLLCLSLALPAVAAGSAKTSWAQPQIRLVTAHGLMGGDLSSFKPDAPLTQSALAQLVAELTEQESSTPAAPEAPATMAGLDASLIKALGLRDAAGAFASGARAAGLAPPSRFGNDSAARILDLGEWETQRVRDAALTFELPDLTSWQRQILRTAVSFIGYPYIWGGTSEKAQTPLGVQTPGGFDCSGFVWRVYKLQTYAGAPKLNQVLRGRTTMQMSGEVP